MYYLFIYFFNLPVRLPFETEDLWLPFIGEEVTVDYTGIGFF